MALTDRLRRLQRAKDEPLDQDHLRDCADLGSERVEDYRLFEDFYDGEHRTRLTERQRLYLEAAGLRWSENFVETAVDIVAERLNVVGFEVPEREDVAEWLTGTVWQGNRMDAVQRTIDTNTLVKGDAFVIASWDVERNRPCFHYNRPELIKPVYDDDGMMLYLVKKWPTSRRSEQNPKGALIWRMNLYYPDRIEKYFSADQDGELWAVWSDDGDESWPVWSTDSGSEDGEPLGILAVHFRRKPLGRRYGRSMVRGLIPFQHELAKQLQDHFEILDTQAWGQRYATGIPEGTSLTVNPGEYLTSTDAAAKFGKIDSEDPAGSLAAIAATLHRMAAKARVPVHLLMLDGKVPSGESLKTAESPLVKQAAGFSVMQGNGYEDLARLGWRLATVYGGEGVPAWDPDVVITTAWDDFETRNELAEATTLEAHHALGVSQATILRKLGYNPGEEAERRHAEQAEEGPPSPDGHDEPPAGEPAE